MVGLGDDDDDNDDDDDDDVHPPMTQLFSPFFISIFQKE